jgi:hypothetical protein
MMVFRLMLRVRSTCIILLAFLASVACVAQQAGDTTITVSGCVVGINGSFKLSTHDGEHYVLKGEHSRLFSYNGMFLEVTGTVRLNSKTSAQARPRTLHVVKLKKLADSCQ